MSELIFKADTDAPKLLKNYLRNDCGISAGLLRRLKNEGGITVNGKAIEGNLLPYADGESYEIIAGI